MLIFNNESKKISLQTLHPYFLALDSLFSTNLLLPPLLHSLLKKILGSFFVEYVYGDQLGYRTSQIGEDL